MQISNKQFINVLQRGWRGVWGGGGVRITTKCSATAKMIKFTVVSNGWNDGTRNGGTTERETAERDFFSVFFFFFFF